MSTTTGKVIISVSIVAVSAFGIYYTNNANALWAIFLALWVWQS